MQGRDFVGQKVLDVGFGNGNNLLFLGSLGLELYGTEVDQEICTAVAKKLSSYQLDVVAKVGTNRQLPFDDDTFDFLTSWNVLHYETDHEGIVAAITEYSRVLKPGGRLLLSTTGPDHKILTGAETLGGHRYRLGRDDDFRKGQVYFYFDHPRYIHHYFSAGFEDIVVGRTHDQLFTETLDWFIVSGVKPR